MSSASKVRRSTALSLVLRACNTHHLIRGRQRYICSSWHGRYSIPCAAIFSEKKWVPLNLHWRLPEQSDVGVNLIIIRTWMRQVPSEEEQIALMGRTETPAISLTRKVSVTCRNQEVMSRVLWDRFGRHYVHILLVYKRVCFLYWWQVCCINGASMKTPWSKFARQYQLVKYNSNWHMLQHDNICVCQYEWKVVLGNSMEILSGNVPSASRHCWLRCWLAQMWRTCTPAAAFKW